MKDPVLLFFNIVLWCGVVIFFASVLVGAGVHYALR